MIGHFLHGVESRERGKKTNVSSPDFILGGLNAMVLDARALQNLFVCRVRTESLDFLLCRTLLK